MLNSVGPFCRLRLLVIILVGYGVLALLCHILDNEITFYSVLRTGICCRR